MKYNQINFFDPIQYFWAGSQERATQGGFYANPREACLSRFPQWQPVKMWIALEHRQ
jgi:hypothetical protein